MRCFVLVPLALLGCLAFPSSSLAYGCADYCIDSIFSSECDAGTLGGYSWWDFAPYGHSHDYASSLHLHADRGISTDQIATFYDARFNARFVTNNSAQVDNRDVAYAALAPAKIKGRAWTRNNDGYGSGLAADKLDGYHASDFIKRINAYKSRIYKLEQRLAALEAKVN